MRQESSASKRRASFPVRMFAIVLRTLPFGLPSAMSLRSIPSSATWAHDARPRARGAPRVSAGRESKTRSAISPTTLENLEWLRVEGWQIVSFPAKRIEEPSAVLREVPPKA